MPAAKFIRSPARQAADEKEEYTGSPRPHITIPYTSCAVVFDTLTISWFGRHVVEENARLL